MFRKLMTGLAVFAATGLFALAQEVEPTGGFDAAWKFGMGSFLIDEQGRTLYINTGELDGPSTCYADCTEEWSPVLLGETLDIGSGVDVAQVGAVVREDGTIQITYGGYPLYRNAGDSRIGQMNGLGTDGTWFAIATSAQPIDATGAVSLVPVNTTGLERGFRVGMGTFVVNSDGAALYAFANDSDTSTCYDDCAVNWPPAIAAADLSVASSLDAELVGSITREDGTPQLTYAGHPLYYFAADEGSSTAGHGAGGVWQLVSAAGELLALPEGAEPAEPVAVEEPAPAAPVEIDAEIMTIGSTVFASGTTPSCSSCHGAAGEGGAGPELIENSALANSQRLIRTVLRGGHIMPAFGDQLNDDRVAAVLTYVRNSWGNDFGAVTPEEVASSR